MKKQISTVWSEIKDYYEVDDEGNVYGYKGKKLKPCHRNKNSGYLTANLRTKDGKWKSFYVHRLVLSVFEGLETGKQVNHKDEDKTNNKLDNLEWVTAKENSNYGTRNMRLTKWLINEETNQITTISDLALECGNSYSYQSKLVAQDKCYPWRVLKFEPISE